MLQKHAPRLGFRLSNRSSLSYFSCCHFRQHRYTRLESDARNFEADLVGTFDMKKASERSMFPSLYKKKIAYSFLDDTKRPHVKFREYWELVRTKSVHEQLSYPSARISSTEPTKLCAATKGAYGEPRISI